MTQTPCLLSSNMEIAVISALLFFKNKVLDKLNPPMSNETKTLEVTILVNGGTRGIFHRMELHDKTINHIDCL